MKKHIEDEPLRKFVSVAALKRIKARARQIKDKIILDEVKKILDS